MTESPFILLVGYPQSGSTFLGEIMGQTDGTLFLCEPLLRMTGRLGEHFDEPIDVTAKMMTKIQNCTLAQIPSISTSLKSCQSYLFEPLKHMDEEEEDVNRRRTAIKRLKDLCRKSKRKVVKSFYIPMRRVQSFLSLLSPEMRQSVTVIYLFRDPRAIINSRHESKTCDSRCWDPERLCSHMHADLTAFSQLIPRMGKRLLFLRYEDLAFHTRKVAKQLFATLGISYTRKVDAYIASHTRANGGKGRLFQDSIQRTKWWTQQLSADEVKKIQSSCSAVLRATAYNELHVGNDGRANRTALFEPLDGDNYVSFPQKIGFESLI